MTDDKPRILNLGTGTHILANAVNHDRVQHCPGIDIAHDLNVLPWPWADSSFDHIVARSVFEHLDIDLLTAVNECWRILDAEGQLDLKLPYWNAEISYCDPTHRRTYAPGVLEMFDPSTRRGEQYGFYTERKWRLVSRDWVNEGRTSFVGTMAVIK